MAGSWLTAWLARRLRAQLVALMLGAMMMRVGMRMLMNDDKDESWKDFPTLDARRTRRIYIYI